MFAGASRGDKAKQLELQDAILSCEDANPILEIVGASLDGFSAINGVTALYRISRCLTSRAGRLRRKEASFVVADRRFKDLVAFVESHARALDRVGLENRKWAYHKLMLPTEYRARAALAVRALDKARDLQGDLVDAMDVESVLVAVEDHAEIFNKVNVSTAVHRVARRDDENAARRVRRFDERRPNGGPRRAVPDAHALGLGKSPRDGHRLRRQRAVGDGAAAARRARGARWTRWRGARARECAGAGRGTCPR